MKPEISKWMGFRESKKIFEIILKIFGKKETLY